MWVVGTEGDQRLHGYNADTGTVVYAGGGPNALMTVKYGKRNTGIVARGVAFISLRTTKSMVLSFREGTPHAQRQHLFRPAIATPQRANRCNGCL